MIPNGATIAGYHTYNDLRLVPLQHLVVAPAQPKLVLVDIPGTDGQIDITEIIYGGVALSNSTGTWNFLILHNDDMQVYTNLVSVFNGEKVDIVLDDEPDVTYRGRLFIQSWSQQEQYGKLSVDYNIDTIDETEEVP